MTATARHSPALVLGVPIDDVTLGETVEEIAALVALGRERMTTHQVVTINVDFLVNALADDGVRAILQQADLAIADGMPVIWGARLAGMPLRERVAGADLVPALAREATARNWKILLFGSAEGVAEQAAAQFIAQHPGAQITGWSGPFMPDVTEVPEEVLARLVAEDADILCVALGNPKQERFIRANRQRLGVPVMIGIGGSLDMLVGGRRRSPRWMQRAGLEWIFRALQEPGRLGRRYAHDAVVFFPALVRWLRVVREYRHLDGIVVREAGEACELTSAAAGAEDVAWARASAAFATGTDVVLDAGSPGGLTCKALALTMDLRKRQVRHGTPSATIRVGAGVARQLARLGRTHHKGTSNQE